MENLLSCSEDALTLLYSGEGGLKMPAGHNSRLACGRNLKFRMEVALNKTVKKSC